MPLRRKHKLEQYEEIKVVPHHRYEGWYSVVGTGKEARNFKSFRSKGEAEIYAKELRHKYQNS